MNDGSTEAFSLPADGLASLATPDVQRLAARMAQDAFTRIFRLTLEGDQMVLWQNLRALCWALDRMREV